MTNALTKSEITDKIRSSALLVSVQLGRYNPVKLDRSESKKVATSNGMKNTNDTKTVKVVKDTLPTASIIKEIESLDGRITKLKDSYCAPFARGIGLLPAHRFFDFNSAINVLFDERDALIKKLADDYAVYRDEARRELTGDLFKEDDYPPVNTVVSRFHHKIDCFKIADPNDSKLNVLGDIAESIQSAVSETLNDKLESVTPYLFELLLKHLCHQSSILQNKDHSLYQSTFDNVLDAAKQASSLNLLDNVQIRNATYEIDACLKADKDEVKENDSLRAQLLKDCNRIIESLDGKIPAPAVHTPSTGRKKKAKVSEAPPSKVDDSKPVLEDFNDNPFNTPASTILREPTDAEIHAAADAASDTFDSDALIAKLGW